MIRSHHELYHWQGRKVKFLPAAPSELLFPSVIAPPDAKKPMTSIRVSLEEESDGAARGALAPLSEVDASERIAA